MIEDVKGRRQLLTGLGLTAAAVTLGTEATVQAAPAFEPARHAENEWMGAVPGKHRVVVDVVTPEGVPESLRFVGNLFTGNKNGYGVEESEVAIIVCLRHTATAYAFAEPVWAKHGRLLDSKAVEAPKANPYDAAPRHALSSLAKRGVRYMVCGAASNLIARRIAGPDGDADATLKEMTAHMIPNSRIVAAGVVGVTHAQEYGYSYLYVG